MKKKKVKPLSNLLYGKETPLGIKLVIVALYTSLVFYTGIIVLAEPFLPDHDCGKQSAGATSPSSSFSSTTTTGTSAATHSKAYSNPDYDTSSCLWTRRAELGYLNSMECDLTRRLLVSVLLGAAIGWERRDSDRPAGIRTMSLVALGACLFTITSMFSFMDGPTSWDASRVSAAIPSGVGFLGAGLIWKGSVGEGEVSEGIIKRDTDQLNDVTTLS